MKKHLDKKIKSCRECDYIFWPWHAKNYKGACRYPDANSYPDNPRLIEHGVDIPDFCPLPDCEEEDE